MKRNKDPQVAAWPVYQEIVNKAEGRPINMGKLERFAFYDRAKTAFAVIGSGDTTPYGNIIIKKGLVRD